MEELKLQNRIGKILSEIPSAIPVVREFIIGEGKGISAAIIYIDGMINKDIIDKDILRPLMIYLKKDISSEPNVLEYLIKRYIPMSNTLIETEIEKAYFNLKRGKTILLIDNVPQFAILDTTAGLTRDIQEPSNETAVRGSREGFVENIETNVSLLKRKIKDKNLAVELMELGRRTQTDLAIVYIKDVVDNDILKEVRKRLQLIDVDGVVATGQIEQFIEDSPSAMFSQIFGSERPDVIAAHILEGRIAIILDGTPYVITVPAMLAGFFQTVEDYYLRTMVANSIRLVRISGILLAIYLPAVYVILTKFNPELIPIKLAISVVKSREQIALTPFLAIISMIIVVELLREGGLRLPTKIAQTLSVVGGFIIGNAALDAKLVAPTTLLVVGVSTIATFVIPNYNISLSIRLVSIIFLLLSNFLGLLGIAAGTFLLLVHMLSMESFGVPYLNTVNANTFRDFITRVPLWKMNQRPSSIPHNDPVRQTDFRKKFEEDNNE